MAKSTFGVGVVAIVLIFGELFANGLSTIPNAPAAQVYPPTHLTEWLQSHATKKQRILFVTPRRGWLPSEVLQTQGRNHPAGVLPPNGAMVYQLRAVNGYDSLSPKAYRQFLAQGEGADVSPPLNGNMILINNVASPALDALRVRYVVVQGQLPPSKVLSGKLHQVRQANGCTIYERAINTNIARKDGKDFYPGWKGDVYHPTTFQLGLFLSLCGWLALMLVAGYSAREKYF